VVDVTETLLSTSAVYSVVTFKAVMSTNDTVTLERYTTIKACTGIKVSDCTIVTFSFSGNVATLTTAGITDELIVVLAVVV